MRNRTRRSMAGAVLLALSLVLAGWATAAGAQRVPIRNRQVIAPPQSVLNIAATLRTMGRTDVADRLIRDYGVEKVVLGDPGSNATTSPPLIVPLVTNRNSNIMTLDKAQVTTVCDTRETDRNPVTTGTIGWALTVVHEYTHMEQDNPTQTPRFENSAWREAIHENQSWMRRVMSQVVETENQPNSAEKIARLRELNRNLDDLRRVHDVTISDLQAEIRAGHVGAGLDWPTIDAGSETDLNRVAADARTLIDTHTRNTRDAIVRIEREMRSGNAEAPRTTTSSGSASGGVAAPQQPKKDLKTRLAELKAKTDKLLKDVNATTAGQQAAGQASASGSPPVAAAAAGGTSLTLELPGYWGHLNYNITGAQLEAPSGSDRGNVGGRQYRGKLSGNTLTISGTARSDNESSGPGSGDYYELVVELNVGSEHKYFGYIAPRGEMLSRSYSLTVPVSADAKSGNFTISLLEQNRNYGPHGWVVTGTLSR